MNPSSFDIVESAAVLILALAAIWLIGAFVVQLIGEITGRLVVRRWMPKFVRIAAVFVGGFLLSAKSVDAGSTANNGDADVERNSGGDAGSLVDVALVGSVATNVALGSFLVAKKRNELRKMVFVGDSKRHADHAVDTESDPVPDWEVLVRVLGPPSVESRDGRPVRFTKGKSLELLVWMTEHRSSSLRSAARTSLWDGNVQDSTFANVVSDIRRGLNAVVGEPDDEEWIPRTFSDRLPLHHAVVTDAQLLRDAVRRCEKGGTEQNHRDLADALNRVTNLPFFGAGYGWADAEGITTSHVVLVVRAAVTLAELAIRDGDTALLFVSTERGLRVLPGHEQLVLLRMRGHAQLGNRAAIKMEWESYARAVEADSWAGGEPSAALREAATQLSKV